MSERGRERLTVDQPWQLFHLLLVLAAGAHCENSLFHPFAADPVPGTDFFNDFRVSLGFTPTRTDRTADSAMW